MDDLTLEQEIYKCLEVMPTVGGQAEFRLKLLGDYWFAGSQENSMGMMVGPKGMGTTPLEAVRALRRALEGNSNK